MKKTELTFWERLLFSVVLAIAVTIALICLALLVYLISGKPITINWWGVAISILVLTAIFMILSIILEKTHSLLGEDDDADER